MKETTREPAATRHPRTVRTDAKRMAFFVEADVEARITRAAKALTGGNRTELLHRIFRQEIKTEDLMQAAG